MQAPMALLVVSTKLTLVFRPFRHVLDGTASSSGVIALTRKFPAASVVIRGEQGTVGRGQFTCLPPFFNVISLVMASHSQQ